MTTAFVLSGGGNLGAMQAGSVVALYEAGVEPDLLVGTSVGAMNAAFLATRPGLEGARALKEAWVALRREEAVQLNPLLAFMGFFGLRNHLVSAAQLRRLFARWIPIDRFEEAAVPFAAVATDALSGEPVVLSRGDIGDALAASSAIPGLFPPVSVDGRWLIDGSLSSNQPVLEAQDLGADEIYLISTATAARIAPPKGAVAIAMNSVSLLTTQVARLQLEEARRRAEQTGGHLHIVPSAEPSAPGRFDYRRSAALSEQAYQRTQDWLSDPAPPAATSPPAARCQRTGPAALAYRERESAQRPPNSSIPAGTGNPTCLSP
jgi:NTE family protein